MRSAPLITGLILAIAVSSVPTLASTTTQRAPIGAGTWAAGGDLGIANRTGDDDLDADPFLGGYLEYFSTDRVSWRGMLSTESMDDPRFRPGPGAPDIEITAVNGNVIYNWTGPHAQPFVTGGLGFYEYDPDLGQEDVEIGSNLGGGVSFFMTRVAALKFEALLHATTADMEPDSFVTASGGLRFQW